MTANFASAATYEVDQSQSACSDIGGDPFCTINAALLAATNGDTVVVYPGEYVENIDFAGADIALVSLHGSEVTKIRAVSGQVVRIGPLGKLEGFTIANGHAPSGAGLSVAGAGTLVKGNVFENNQQSGHGFGAAIGGGGSPIIDGNIFQTNVCDDFQLSGVVGFVGGSPTIINNVFRFNPCRAINLTLSASEQPVVAFNTIVSNTVGIRVDRRNSADAQIYRNNIIVGNDIGLAVEFGDESQNPIWENNILFDNGVNYEVIQDQTGVNGNTNDDPKFIDRQGLDYRLLAESPAIDAGSAIVEVHTDYLGNNRPTDGDGDDRADMDIGAFESYLPEADAGTDTVMPRGEMVHLSGVRSSDVDGHIVGFHWRQLAGPTITLENALTDIPSFLAPASSGTVTVELEVTDESGHTATDQVDVRINALPRAVAGQDFTVHEGSSGHLNGTSSSDEDGGIQAFSWQQIDGAQVALMGADTSTPEFVAPHIATHLVFRLIVTDDAGGSAEDDVSVAVNLLPIVEAGSNLIVTGGSPTSLDGSASMDRDGSIVEFSWRQLAGEMVVMSGAQTDNMSFVAPHSPGTLQFRLDVTDNQGGQGFDDVTVTVRSPSNNAGQSGGGGAAGIWTLFGLIASAVIRLRSRLAGSPTSDSR